MSQSHAADTLPAVDVPRFREAMSRIASAVHVLTTDGASGRCGATVSAACSLTDAPPALIVCVNRTSRIHAAVLENRVFCLNTLAGHQSALSDIFAGRAGADMEPRFAAASWEQLVTGAPVLSDALMSADCSLLQAHDVGSHTIFVGALKAVQLGSAAEALVYKGRAYHSL
ncbi:flavin reductase family protein [Pannonibacter tanglangensis]|uniref:flavin reductase family protein n=1 Tax=Pannonibacter tanglangensis TaxID=2750084 RepID=UPI001AD94F22|nr:flavin reductase family protein [Pannonibacter sp. XCT-34]